MNYCLLRTTPCRQFIHGKRLQLTICLDIDIELDFFGNLALKENSINGRNFQQFNLLFIFFYKIEGLIRDLNLYNKRLCHYQNLRAL